MKCAIKRRHSTLIQQFWPCAGDGHFSPIGGYHAGEVHVLIVNRGVPTGGPTSNSVILTCYCAGDGHFSPIGGYHAGRDLVLILDTARFKYPPHWCEPDLCRSGSWSAAGTLASSTRGLDRGRLFARFVEQTALRLPCAAPPSPMLHLTAGSTAAPQGAAAGAAQSDVRARGPGAFSGIRIVAPSACLPPVLQFRSSY